MRILLVSHTFLPDSRFGVELYTYYVAKALMALGHSVHLFFSERGTNRKRNAQFEGIGFTALNQLRQRGPKALDYRHPTIESDFGLVLDQYQPDIVHFQHLLHLSSRLPAIAKSHGVGTVMTLHDYWLMCPKIKLFDRWAKPCFQSTKWKCASCCRNRFSRFTWSTDKAEDSKTSSWWKQCLKEFAFQIMERPLAWHRIRRREGELKEMIKAIDMFIGPSKFVCNQAISWGIPRTRVIQIDNGTRELPYRCHEKTASQRPKFGYIGGLTVEKGIKTLLNAFQAIELADLFIYGGQPEELRAMFRDKIKSNIYLQGTINDDAKTVLLPKLDALIVPSIWHEIGPIVIQEAFAAKVPVICSALDPMTNRVNDGIDGLLFPAGDEDALRRILQRCIDEPDLLPRLRMGIRQPKSMSFHIENEILPLYQQLANQNLWDTAPKTLV